MAARAVVFAGGGALTGAAAATGAAVAGRTIRRPLASYIAVWAAICLLCLCVRGGI